MFGKKMNLAGGGGQSNGEQIGSGIWIKRLTPKVTKMTVRPMTEPDSGSWQTYNEVYDDTVKRSWPLPEGQLVEDPDQEVKTKHLAIFFDVENERMIALQMAKTLAQAFITYKQDTGQSCCDRDWIVSRTGSGFDTRYGASALDAAPRDLSKYEVPTVEQVLAEQYQRAVNEGWAPPIEGVEMPTESAPTHEAPAEEPKPEPPAEKAPEPEPEPEEAPEAETPTNGSTPTGLSEDEWVVHLEGAPLSELRTEARKHSINPTGMSKREIIEALAQYPPL